MLPQKPAPRLREMYLRRSVLWIALPVLGALAVLGIMPEPLASASVPHLQVKEIALPAFAPSGAATELWRFDHTRSGDTVASLLHRLDVEDRDAERFLRTSRAASGLRKLDANLPVQAQIGPDGSLLSLRYPAAGGVEMLVEKTRAGFSTRSIPAQIERRIYMRTGKIKTSLFQAADAVGLPEPAISQLSEIFGGAVDFHHALQFGDEFAVVYQVTYVDGEPTQDGRVLAAEFINHGRVYRALYFRDGETDGYYTPEGDSLHRQFLLSPVEFSRISSGFSTARYHPILHKWRAHKGVDFAAPMGTRIEATAEGTVEFAGKETGYGNVVIIRHDARYSTVYGHMLRFIPHLHRGQHVTQGEVIGYVGMSGWATGPHVHYEFRVDNLPHNPMRYNSANAPPISEAERSAFLNATGGLDTRLDMLHDINLARNQ